VSTSTALKSLYHKSWAAAHGSYEAQHGATEGMQRVAPLIRLLL
jgi:hypothetical protein